MTSWYHCEKSASRVVIADRAPPPPPPPPFCFCFCFCGFGCFSAVDDDIAKRPLLATRRPSCDTAGSGRPASQPPTRVVVSRIAIDVLMEELAMTVKRVGESGDTAFDPHGEEVEFFGVHIRRPDKE